MRVYICRFKGEDWICVVVAWTAREAKRLFWHKQPFGRQEPEAWLDIRAIWLRGVVLSCKPQLFSYCTQARWMCSAWDFDEATCRGCILYVKKRKEDEVTP